MDRFNKDDLIVLYVLSHNYYKSPACLNEMGAAWALKKTYMAFLLSKFGFEEIRGCIDANQISIKLDEGDNSNLKHRLFELKEMLTEEFKLRIMSNTSWERKRDKFLSEIENIRKNSVSLENEVEKDEINNNARNMSKDASVMLIYAATEEDGQILVVPYIDGTSIEIGDINFIKDGLPREVARWKGAIAELEKNEYIKKSGKNGEIYEITNMGYKCVDVLKEKYSIKTKEDIQKYIDN